MSAVERASQLGAEHGRRDAETWPPFPMDAAQWAEVARLLATDPDNGWRDPYCWPEPDLSDDFVDTLPQDLVGKKWAEWVAAYESAYREAVEARVREVAFRDSSLYRLRSTKGLRQS